MALNKSQKNVSQQFDQKQFNKMFEEKEKDVEKQFKQDNSMDMVIVDEIGGANINILPHQRPIEDIIIMTRETFFKTLEKIQSRENPLPWIQESPDRFFTAALFMIIVGACMLLLSSLMKFNKK
jgi:hypothetical protein